jgi:hypothetical protein
MKSSSIAFATYAAHPAVLPDDDLAAAALRERGVCVTGAVWDDERVDWGSFDAVVIRSAWDYYRKPASFLLWLDALEKANVRVFNPIPLMRWNADKIYLRALNQAGVHIVPTVWIEQGAGLKMSLDKVLQEQGWSNVILKPTISAGAYRTARFDAVQAAECQLLLTEITSTSHAMLQPFMREIETSGELSFMFFNDSHNSSQEAVSSYLSHCIRKTPQRGDFRIQEEFGGANTLIRPDAELVSQACHALNMALHLGCTPTAGEKSQTWLYARVDGVETSTGLALMEIELIEPSLFFAFDVAAPDRFATALVARL